MLSHAAPATHEHSSRGVGRYTQHTRARAPSNRIIQGENLAILRDLPTKDDNLLWYTRHPTRYTFRLEDSDCIPYMAPRLVGAAKAARGKTPTNVWWHTIVSPTGKEKTGYPTQKPVGILERIVRVHSNPGDTVLDFFAGSGTTGEAAARNGRCVLLVDESEATVRLMAERLKQYGATITSVAS